MKEQDKGVYTCTPFNKWLGKKREAKLIVLGMYCKKVVYVFKCYVSVIEIILSLFIQLQGSYSQGKHLLLGQSGIVKKFYWNLKKSGKCQEILLSMQMNYLVQAHRRG